MGSVIFLLIIASFVFIGSSSHVLFKSFISFLLIAVYITPVSAGEAYNGVLNYRDMNAPGSFSRLLNQSWIDSANGMPILDSAMSQDNTNGVNGSGALCVNYTKNLVKDDLIAYYGGQDAYNTKYTSSGAPNEPTFLNFHKGDRVLMASGTNIWEQSKYAYSEEAGYTYFQSAMVKLGRATTASLTSGIQHTHSGTIAGFNTSGADFASKLAAYSTTPGNMGNYANTGSITLSQNWSRVSTAYYMDTVNGSATGSVAGALRVSVGIAGTKTDATSENPLPVYIDDYVIIKVPNSDLLAEVYPMVGNIGINKSSESIAEGTVLTANANVYDVNPMAQATAKYQWQSSADGKDYTDISGATSDKYTVTSNELGGKYIRVVVTSSSVCSDTTTVSHTGSSAPVISPVLPVLNSVAVTGDPMVGKELKAEVSATDVTGEIKSYTYVWQISSDNKAWSDIVDAVSEAYTPKAEDADKYVRVSVYANSDNYGKSNTVVSAGTKIFAAAVLPTVSNVAITAGNTSIDLTYKYDGTDEGTSVVSWELSPDGTKDWKAVDGQNGRSYAVTLADAGKYIRASVVPVRNNGLKGAAVYSNVLKVLPPVYGNADIYIASNGSDSGTGSIDSPYATFEKAQTVAKSLIALGYPVTVNIRGGVYYRDTTLTLAAEDSGTDVAPVTWKAYNGEKVTITGGKKIPSTNVSKVTDASILNRVSQKSSRDQLMSIDLAGVFEGDLPKWINADNNENPQAIQVYYNGQSLAMARWPKENANNLSVSENVSNTEFKFNDTTKRTKNWQLNNVMVQGHLNATYFWHGFNVTSINSETGTVQIENPKPTTIRAAGVDTTFYFLNILEEISKPGECYVDFAAKKVYFYPFSNMNTGDMYIPVSTATSLDINGASYVNVEGIDFRYLRGSFISIQGQSKNVCVNNCSFIGSTGGNTISGNSNTVMNSRFYDTGVINLTGGNAGGFSGGHNVVKNCSIECMSNFKTYGNGISTYGYDHQITNNDIYNSNGCLIQLGWGSVDTYIGYNNLHDGVKNAGDWAAIYWGRAVHSIGIEFDHNFMYANGSKYHNGWSQSIFTDDGGVGANIHDNIFYQATLPSKDGGTLYCLKTYGGQYMNVENNIFVENPYACFFQNYNPSGWQGWYLSCLNKTTAVNDSANDWLGYLKRNGYFNGTAWQDHYKGTQWEDFTKLFTTEIAEQVKGYDYKNADDYKKLLEIAGQHYKADQNFFKNNLLVNEGNNDRGLAYGSVGVESGTVGVSDKGMFVNYGTDFQLTASGLSSVQSKNPAFRNIETGNIGPVPFEYNGKMQTVAGGAPVASDIMVTGTNTVNNIVSVKYDYSDPDNHKEGNTKYQWYVASSADGKYTAIEGATGWNYSIAPEYAGSYLKCQVIPCDEIHIFGTPVMSKAVGVDAEGTIDKQALRTAIDDAQRLVSGAVIGTEDGNYPKTAVDTLKSEIAAAQSVVNSLNVTQFAVNSAETKLNAAIDAFKTEKIQNIKYVSLRSALTDQAGWITRSGDAPVFNGTSMTVKSGSRVSYKLDENKIYTFRMKLVADAGVDTSSAIYFRESDPASDIWLNGNTGYLLWIHKDNLECQKWTPQNLTSVPNNNIIENNKEYEIRLGVYDMEGGNVRYILKVDGNTVFDKIFTENNHYGKDGWFAFSSGKSDMIISPAEVDTAELSKCISESEALLSGSVEGSNYGEYPTLATLDSAIKEAKVAQSDPKLLQQDIDKALFTLKNAVNVFRTTAVATGNYSSDTTVNMNYDIPKADFTAANNAKLTINTKSATALPEIKFKSGDILLKIPAGTVLSGSSCALPSLLNQPTGTMAGKDPRKVISFGKASASNTVRILIHGEKNRKVAYLADNGSYTDITTKLDTDSFDAANKLIGGKVLAVKMNLGDDLVIYTTVLSETVTYSVSTDDENNNNPPSPGGGGGGGSVVHSKGSTVGGTFDGEPVVPSVENPSFTDIKGHWAEQDILKMSEVGIVKGVSETAFEPDRIITRAEFATLIKNALKLDVGKNAGFSDVSSSDWFMGAVSAVANANLMNGDGKEFRPNDNITREEMAVIIVKACEYLKKEVKSGSSSFKDKDSISQWAAKYVDDAVATGLIKGMDEDTFAPKAFATRAQAASLILRLLS